ncbi:MAG: TetR/AcrR family transcriptional regulator, partial [Pseudomonadota bacterium]
MQTEENHHGSRKERTETERRILAAGRVLFMADGFSGVSTDMLCREAGVSKTSLYKYFGNMMGVLEAMVEEEGDLYDLGPVTPTDGEGAFWTALHTFGHNLLTLLNNEFCIKLDRMLHEEARTHPELAERFYNAAYGRGHREVAGLIELGRARGYVTVERSSTDLADNLICMWEGMAFVRTRLGLSDAPFPEPERWARQCV